jgi:hypothetical protein
VVDEQLVPSYVVSFSLSTGGSARVLTVRSKTGANEIGELRHCLDISENGVFDS